MWGFADDLGVWLDSDVPGDTFDLAVGAWGNCGAPGAEFPSFFQVYPSPAFAEIDVYYNDSTGSSCGLADVEYNANGRIIGAEITLWRDAGPSYPCNVAHWLAHELGHALGMDNNNCGLMNPTHGSQAPVGSAGTPVQGECDTADDAWGTLPEEEKGEEVPYQPCEPSPLILDLGPVGLSLVGVEDSVWFDIDGDGRLEAIGWTRRLADDGFLWMDRNGNGQVDSGRELFGTATLLPNREMSHDGFQALAILDDPLFGGDGDNLFTNADSGWQAVRVWIDRDHNASATPSEVYTLKRLGIVAIEVIPHASDRRDRFENSYRYWARFYVESRRRALVRKVVDVVFASDE